MSGIEIAGIILGALPILFAALDGYKDSINRLGQGFRKRKAVEKLARALRMQKQTLETIVKLILLESGCESLLLEEAQIRETLIDQLNKDRVKEYLGPQNDLTFSDAITECFDSVQRVTSRIATYVPSLKGVPEVQAVIDANKASGQFEWRARISMVIYANDMKDEIKAIDDSIDTLDRFTTNLRTLRHLEEAMPSQKATRLARSLRKVRQYTDSLHSALAQCWQKNCHVHHEAKLFLDARLDDTLSRKARKDPTCHFRIVLTCDPPLSTEFWHETAIHAKDEDENMADSCSSPNPKGQQVKLVAPQLVPPGPKMNIIQDLCLALKMAENDKKDPVFHLTGEKKIGMLLNPPNPLASSQALKSVTLKEILDATSSAGKNTGEPPLPLYARMDLALKIGSSFLQFLQTPWIHPTWSASGVHFLRKGPGHEVDILQPYISVRFDNPCVVSIPAQQQQLVRNGLQELGILLLEIWHSTPFETKYPPQTSAAGAGGPHPRIRLACALDWLDEVQNPLLDHYHTAVTNCIVRVLMNEVRMPDWDDMKLWRAVCEGVIDPLHKVVQCWSMCSGP